jgi:hypothetical protein
MTRLAFFTIGILHGPADDPLVAEFVEQIPGTWDVAARCAGFIDTARSLDDWGPTILPKFVDERLRPNFAQTFSLWEAIESVHAFTYAGRHADGLARRSKWFRTQSHPGYVAWWVADDHRPDTAEAIRPIEQSHEQGLAATGFSFRAPFGPDAWPYAINRDKVRTLVEANRDRANSG